MLIIEADDLEAQGVLYQGASEFVFHGKEMVSSLAFSMRLLQTAIDLCQQELEAGNFCLLVKKFNYITVWKEKPVEQLEEQPGKNPSAIAPASTEPLQSANPVIIDDPERPIAEQLPGEPLPQFSAAQLTPYPTIRQSFKADDSAYTVSNGAVPNGAVLNGGIASVQENGATLKPIHWENRGRDDQAVQPAKPPQSSNRPTANTPPVLPPPNTLTPKGKQPANLDPTFLEDCQQALAYCIGPIAPLIIEEVLANNPPNSPNQLIDALSEEIPNPEAAREFRNRLRSM